MKLFKPQAIDREERDKRVLFLKNIHSVLSNSSSIPKEEQQKIFLGALLCTGLTVNEVKETILNKYN